MRIPVIHFDDADIFCGDALDVLAEMPSESINCCITSPPYWGLRDYGDEGQLGLEPIIEEYTEKMVMIFREVRRVLAPDGTLWLNMGDTYATGGMQGHRRGERFGGFAGKLPPGRSKAPAGLKPKDLCGIPWRVAFALQADGWYLRQDIIWHKPNPMPESVTDRCTKAHEYVFLMTKSTKYWYDAEAIKETASAESHMRYARGRSTTHKHADGGPGNQTIAKTFEHMRAPGVNTKAVKANVLANWDTTKGQGGHGKFLKNLRRDKPNSCHVARIKQNESFSAAVVDLVGKRNKRSVWTVPSDPYPEAHFATYPPDLIRPCVRAGCPTGGTVLDPFAGSGTTGQVAIENGRKFIGIELNPEYVDLIRKRISGIAAQGRLEL